MTPPIALESRATRRAEGARHRDGQTLALFALLLTILLGVSALAVDYGTWLLGRRGLQNAADAAVLSGTMQLTNPISGNCTGSKTKVRCARESAWSSLSDSLSLGLDAAAIAALGTSNTSEAAPSVVNGYRIWVDTPPSAAGTRYPGRYGTTNTAVFVWAEHDQPSFLGLALGQGNRTISAWASAGNQRGPQGAITALCGSDANDNSDCTSNNANNPTAAIKVNTNNGIRILGGGDLVSDHSLVVTAGPGVALDSGIPYIVGASNCDHQTWSCAPSTSSGITDTALPPNAVAAVELSPMVTDPIYPQPSWTNCEAAPVVGNCVPVRGAGAIGSGPNYTPGSYICNGNGCGSTSGSGAAMTCTAGATTLAPGYYDTIKSSGCLILDGTSPGSTTVYTSTTGMWRGQRPGVYRIRTSLNVNVLVGDGVTIFLDPGASFSVSGALILNTGNTCGTTNPNLATWSGAACAGTDFSRGAWSTAGTSPWDACDQSSLPATSRCVTIASNYHAITSGSGLALYVRPPRTGEVPGNGKLSQTTTGSWTTKMVQFTGNGWLYFLGTLYAPRDNVVVAGNPSQASSGTILAWTITYGGTAQFVQTYTGVVAPLRPYLLEPTIGQ